MSVRGGSGRERWGALGIGVRLKSGPSEWVSKSFDPKKEPLFKNGAKGVYSG